MNSIVCVQKGLSITSTLTKTSFCKEKVPVLTRRGQITEFSEVLQLFKIITTYLAREDSVQSWIPKGEVQSFIHNFLDKYQKVFLCNDGLKPMYNTIQSIEIQYGNYKKGIQVFLMNICLTQKLLDLDVHSFAECTGGVVPLFAEHSH